MFNTTDVTVRNNLNQSLNINAVSGTIVKSCVKSFIIRFNAKSEIAKDILDKNPRMVKYTEYHENRYGSGHRYAEPIYEPIVVLQIMLCGDNEFLAEIIWKEDFDKMMEPQIVELKDDNCSVTNQKLAVYEEIVNSGNCNVCGKRSTCEYCPKLGELIRYNCPLYERKKED